jgi:hypothetical protein
MDLTKPPEVPPCPTGDDHLAEVGCASQARSPTDGFSEVERNASDEKFSPPNLSFSLETELCVQ